MEERKMILKMIEDGKITAEEGLKLLEAIEKGTASERADSTDLSTDVNWEKGDDYFKQARQSKTSTSAANMFTSFIESTIQKIKDVDLDFNFGTSYDVDHIFQHRDVTPKHLDVSLENGLLTIKPWDENVVRIECKAKVYRVKDDGEARRFFMQHALFRADDDKLVFETKSKAMKVQTTLFVPKAEYARIKLYTFNGQIQGSNLRVDTFDANAVNGSLVFDDIEAKKIDAETINGGIEYENIRVDLMDVETMNGSITLSGDIQDVEAETINGQITYRLGRLKENGYADLKAATGSIYVYIPNDIRIEGKLKTNVGGFQLNGNDYDVLEEKREFVQKSLHFIGNQSSSPRLKLNALANTGTIHVNDK